MRKTAGGAVAVLALALERELDESPDGRTLDHPALEAVEVVGAILVSAVERKLSDDQGYRVLREVERYLLANGPGGQRGAVLQLAREAARREAAGEVHYETVGTDDGWQPSHLRDRRRLFGR